MTDSTIWSFSVNQTGQLCGRSDADSLSCRLAAPASRLAKHFGERLPARLADLVEISHMMHGADRLVARGPNWRRRFVIQAPVRDLGFWRRLDVAQALQDVLHYLTDDDWVVRFEDAPWSVDRPQLQKIFPEQKPLAACLFSGGLDSLAGLAVDVSEAKFKTIVPVCCTASPRLKAVQRKLLNGVFPNREVAVRPVFLSVAIGQEKGQYSRNERTQRTRGFLFGCLGAVAASMAGANRLRIYENGVGAINLPLTAAQVGTQSTRSTHPLALYKLSRLLSLVFDEEFFLDLPFIFSTKGELCSRLAATKWRRLTGDSVSCDSFPLRTKGPVHCGECTSCLLRRQACWVAGLIEDQIPDAYRADVLSGDPDLDFRPLADMVIQAQRLNWEVSKAEPWSQLAAEFTEIIEVVEALQMQGEVESESRLVDLYSRYSLEWKRFPARPLGWRMAA